MAEQLRFHPLVVTDLAAATRWYDEISVELGNRFRQAIESKLDSIEFGPESFGLVHEPLRAALLEGFPYLVLFEHRRDITEILGVFHAASDPAKWNRRV